MVVNWIICMLTGHDWTAVWQGDDGWWRCKRCRLDPDVRLEDAYPSGPHRRQRRS